MTWIFAVAEPAAGGFLYYARWTDRLCWIAFCLVWLSSWLSANRPIKRSQDLPTRVLQLALYALGIVLLFLSKMLPIPVLDFRLLPRSDGLAAAAAALTLIGTALAIWARTLLGSNWSARVTVKEGHELIEVGPYRFVRHPIYSGLTVALFGTALLRCSPRSLLAVAVFLAVFLWKIRIEERFLTAEFGERYRQYQRRVKALVPFVV